MAGMRGGSAGEEVDDDNGVVITPAIRVNQARQLFGVKGDEILAQNLQDKEFQEKYCWNREVRQIARKDVPLAKSTHDEEEERLQRERLEFLQNQARIAEEDAKLAHQYQKEEQLAKERERLKQDILDQELAKRIQLMEIQEQSRPEVRRTRDTDNNGQGAVHTVIRMSSFAGFHLPSSTGDDGLTEDDGKQLMLLQDEELALALQEHEQLKALRSKQSQARARLVAAEHVAPPLVLVVQPVHQEQLQRTAAASRRPDDVQSTRGTVRGAGISPPSAGQIGSRSPGPPTYQAPRAPVHHVIQTHTTRNANDVSDKTVTLVTSVGNSEFFKTVPPSEAASREPNTQSKSSRMAPETRRNSPAEINRTQSAQTNRKVSNQEAARKAKSNNQ